MPACGMAESISRSMEGSTTHKQLEHCLKSALRPSSWARPLHATSCRFARRRVRQGTACAPTWLGGRCLFGPLTVNVISQSTLASTASNYVLAVFFRGTAVSPRTIVRSRLSALLSPRPLETHSLRRCARFERRIFPRAFGPQLRTLGLDRPAPTIDGSLLDPQVPPAASEEARVVNQQHRPGNRLPCQNSLSLTVGSAPMVSWA